MVEVTWSVTSEVYIRAPGFQMFTKVPGLRACICMKPCDAVNTRGAAGIELLNFQIHGRRRFRGLHKTLLVLNLFIHPDVDEAASRGQPD